MQRKKVGIVIFDDVEVLDFCGPFEGFFLMGHAPAVETLASVCTGSLLLGKAGLLDGVRGTTHWQALDLMAQLFPNVDVDGTSYVVEQGIRRPGSPRASTWRLSCRVITATRSPGRPRNTWSTHIPNRTPAVCP